MDLDPDFSGSDPDFRPIRTQEKNSIRIRKKTRSETLLRRESSEK